jgi:ferredoxin-NADP reductase
MTTVDTTLGAKLRERREIAEGTMAFHFEKPAGFSFKAGQAIDLVLPGDPGADAQSLRHAFSIVAAPFEDELAIATRMRDSAYKRTLKSLPVGAIVDIEGPFGSLTLHKDRARDAVFIAGGIGITPFMSLLRQAAKDGFPQRICLLYSNRRPEDAAFLDELQQLGRANDRFRLVATMTEIAKSALAWNGESRLVDADLLKTAARGLAAPIYYLAGPPAMVEGMRKMMNASGIDDDDIRSEDFYGY